MDFIVIVLIVSNPNRLIITHSHPKNFPFSLKKIVNTAKYKTNKQKIHPFCPKYIKKNDKDIELIQKKKKIFCINLKKK